MKKDRDILGGIQYQAGEPRKINEIAKKTSENAGAGGVKVAFCRCSDSKKEAEHRKYIRSPLQEEHTKNWFELKYV